MTTEAQEALETCKILGFTKERATQLLKRANLASDKEIELLIKNADWSDWGRFGLDMAGMTLGGVAGSFLPGANVAGGIAGGMAGSYAGRWLGNALLGKKKEPAPTTEQPAAQPVTTTQRPAFPQMNNTLFNQGFQPYQGVDNQPKQLPTLWNQKQSSLSSIVERLYAMFRKSAQMSLTFHKAAGSRWRQPDKLKLVKNRVNKNIAAQADPVEAGAKIRRLNNVDTEQQKRMITDEFTLNRDMYAMTGNRGRTEAPIPQPPYIPSRASKTRAAGIRREYANQPLPTIQQLDRDRISTTLRQSDPLAQKQHAFANGPKPRTLPGYRLRMQRAGYDDNYAPTLEREQRVYKAQDTKLIQEYMQKVLPYLAGGAGIAGAGVLAANS